MSWAVGSAPERNALVARALNVNAETVRAEMYGLLERNRTGRGRLYTHYLLTNKRTGQVFPAKERPSPHRASAPGDAPARDTGRLMEAVAVTKRATPANLVAEIGPREQAFKAAFYPGFLEYGTRSIAPRPFVRPTADRVTKLFRAGGFRVDGGT